MNYIAIDTSGKNLAIVIIKGDKRYSYFDDNCGLKHSLTLMPELEKLLIQADFKISDADFIACVVGAGSFTGIRIGVSTVKALCFAYNKPCLSLTTFDLLAYNKQDEKGKLLTLVDAGHNGFYVRRYDNGLAIEDAKYLLIDQVSEMAKEYKPLSFDDITVLSVEKCNAVQGIINATEKLSKNATYDLDDIVPLYVRKSQAEEGRP